jgi:hypothetical protein
MNTIPIMMTAVCHVISGEELNKSGTLDFCSTEYTKFVRTGRLLIPENGEVSLITLLVEEYSGFIFAVVK